MDLLKSPIKKLYRSYLVPSLSAAVVTSVYGFVDTIAIGQGVGPDGAAALAIAQPIFGVVSFFGLLCGIGGSVYLGKARGKQKMEKSNAYFFASLCLAVAFRKRITCCKPLSHFMLDLLYAKRFSVN